MTNMRAALVLVREPFFIALGGPKAHDSSGRDEKGRAVTFREISDLDGLS